MEEKQNLLQHLEAKYSQSLSDDGRKWFTGLINGSPFGIVPEDILYKAVFDLLGVERFPVGQEFANEWDELDGTLRVIIAKTGYGENILTRLRHLHRNEDFITPEEQQEIERRLEYYPHILEEFRSRYDNFAFIAPRIYEITDYLKHYHGGIPALELCFLHAYAREMGLDRDKALDNAISRYNEKNLKLIKICNAHISSSPISTSSAPRQKGSYRPLPPSAPKRIPSA